MTKIILKEKANTATTLLSLSGSDLTNSHQCKSDKHCKAKKSYKKTNFKAQKQSRNKKILNLW